MSLHAADERRRPNRLAHEKSPYLLQHAWNPVDWHPWGEAAFERAKAEAKPIFLSIGYSTCHWCHVMERESFEDEAVAALLNRLFVPVKVDREERPDVDRLYMTAMQALGMGGGWPLNVFLTPELDPFYGGTYFPPRSVPGRIGMIDLLPRVHQAWQERREDVERQGHSILTALASLREETAAVSPGRAALFEGCRDALGQTFDSEWGGFGQAPKFPQVVNLDFLFRHYAQDREHHGRSLDMALRQLDAMRRGGIQDHLGGGFHRYSTDREWLVPHFEKMLYDQAQLASAYVDAHLLTGSPVYADVARGIFGYVARDLTTSEGAFASAEDADSEGEEGRFYVWTPAEIAAALPSHQAELVITHYGVTPHGNFEHGTTILRETRSLEETAGRFGLTMEAAATRLAEARAALLAARSLRPRPHRDDKVLAAWNGLMIAAFARGSRVLNDPALLSRAVTAAEFVWDRLRDHASGALRRRYRDGEAAGAGQLDDYAYLAFGSIELYRASLDPIWLERAVVLTEAQLERFEDDSGGFFDSPADDPYLRVRLKDEFDGAEIAGNSIAAENLQTLAALLDRADWRRELEHSFEHFERKLARHPIAMPRMLAAMLLDELPARHVVIAGRRDAEDTRALVRVFDQRFLPRDVLLWTDEGEVRQRLSKLAPFAATLELREGRATAYVCVEYACQLPVAEPAALAAQLDAPAAPARSGEPR